MHAIHFLSVFLLATVPAMSQDASFSVQPASGPGGMDYSHGEVDFSGAGTDADAYWIFEPADPKPDSADVVIFLHGYGSYNPFSYGKWIRHLVSKGNIVIYPRYQNNNFFPRPPAFPAHAATGIRNALAELQQPGRVHPRTDKVVYIGHSYGGVIAANFGVNWQKYALPYPAAMLLCEPGSGPFTGARLGSYKDLQSDCKLLVVVGEHDDVVGDSFGRLVFETAVNATARNFLVQRSDTSAQRGIRASHAEPYCLDMAFDNGARNYTAKSVLRRSRLDAVDYFCYWKLADALIAFTRNNIYGEVAFGNTPEQRFMGCSADGCAIRELDVELPAPSGQTGLTAAAVKRSFPKARR